MNYIIVCRELQWDQNAEKVTSYYKVPEEWGDFNEAGQFIFNISKESEKQIVNIAEIIEIKSAKSFNQEINLLTLSENEKIHLVSNEFFLRPMIDIMDIHINDSVKELRKFLNSLIKNMEYEMFLTRKSPISDKRKKYLLELFWNYSIEEFDIESEKQKSNWLHVFGNYELDLIYEINLYNLREVIINHIKSNKTITNIDKVELEIEYLDKIKTISSTINSKGNARYLMDEYIGITTSSDGKDIVLGKMSPMEFYLNFFSFWNIIKSLLTVSFIPVIVALLTSNKKIIIYCFLAIVYLIPLILSDEKQTDKVITFMNQIKANNKNKVKDEKRISYSTLFYYGIISVFVFIIFSIEVVYLPYIVDELSSFVIYLIGDILLAYTFLFIILSFVSLFFWMITAISSTVFYIKKAKKLMIIFSFCFKILFWIFGDYCLYFMLGMKVNITNSNIPDWKVVMFCIALLISLINIIGNISELKKLIKK